MIQIEGNTPNSGLYLADVCREYELLQLKYNVTLEALNALLAAIEALENNPKSDPVGFWQKLTQLHRVAKTIRARLL